MTDRRYLDRWSLFSGFNGLISEDRTYWFLGVIVRLKVATWITIPSPDLVKKIIDKMHIAEHVR
jgi:hypothetical protein